MSVGTQTDDGRKIDADWEAVRAAAEARRPAEAEARGGWIYSVRVLEHPLAVARHYGGNRAGVLAELLALNPRQEAGACDVCRACQEGKPCPRPLTRWDARRWFAGAGILLPVAWGDPQKKPRMRIVLVGGA